MRKYVVVLDDGYSTITVVDKEINAYKGYDYVEFTCNNCKKWNKCPYAFQIYNLNGCCKAKGE